MKFRSLAAFGLAIPLLAVAVPAAAAPADAQRTDNECTTLSGSITRCVTLHETSKVEVDHSFVNGKFSATTTDAGGTTLAVIERNYHFHTVTQDGEVKVIHQNSRNQTTAADQTCTTSRNMTISDGSLRHSDTSQDCR